MLTILRNRLAESRSLRCVFSVVAVLLLAAAARPAYATTIPASATVFFNYDFTLQVPPPPYTGGSVTTAFNFANVGPGTNASFDLFDGLNGVGALLFTVPNITVPGPTGSLTVSNIVFPGVLDGVFSWRVSGVNLPFDVVTAPSTAFNAAGVPVTVTPTIVGRVPEPSTIALVITGLAGGMRLRRRG